MRRKAILCFMLQLIFELSSCTEILVMRGSKLDLPCLTSESYSTDIEEITWKHNGNVIFHHFPPSSSEFYFHISPVTSASQGVYECVMKGSDVEMIQTFNVTVDGLSVYQMKAFEKSDVKLPCDIPRSKQVSIKALWFKEEGNGEKRMLNLEDDVTDGDKKMYLIYTDDPDQTIIIKNIGLEDAGIYHCDLDDGEKLSIVNVSVEVRPTPSSDICKNSTSPWEPCQDENGRTGEPILQESIAAFALKLYSYLRESNPSTNLLFSPVSISGALSHLLLGARNDTRKAFESAISVPHNFHCVHFQMKKLREKMDSSLQMASQIYYNPSMNLSKSFIDQSIQFYDAKPTKLLNSTQENTQMINSWVAAKTKNKITSLVESVPSSSQLILVNAVTFAGQWKVMFHQKPKKGAFTKLNGDVVKVPILHHQKYTATMIYDAQLKAQVARFALTGDSSLYILLPHSNTAAALQQVEQKMTDTLVGQMIEIVKATPPQNIEVTLPHIKLDIQPDMNMLLRKLGLSALYEGAELCGLYPEEKLYLDDAKHRAFLTLTEQGVEAGAVTSLSFSRSLPSFSALRPFILLLWNDHTNVPLFIGRVTAP